MGMKKQLSAAGKNKLQSASLDNKKMASETQQGNSQKFPRFEILQIVGITYLCVFDSLPGKREHHSS
jgi:hypothetical protein